MKKRKRLPKSIRKYIRREKSRLRREILDLEEQKKRIEQIYQGQSILTHIPYTFKRLKNNERKVCWM
jgi:hypothetical protein